MEKKRNIVAVITEGQHKYGRDAEGNIYKNGLLIPSENYKYIPAEIGGLRISNPILTGLKRELLNILEGIGLPDKQEAVIKRQVTDALHKYAS